MYKTRLIIDNASRWTSKLRKSLSSLSPAIVCSRKVSTTFETLLLSYLTELSKWVGWFSLYFSKTHPVILEASEAAIQRCSSEEMFWKYAANLQENTYTEMWFQQSCFASLLKSHFGMSVLLLICCIFSEHLVKRIPLEGCFWRFKQPLKVFYKTSCS